MDTSRRPYSHIHRYTPHTYTQWQPGDLRAALLTIAVIIAAALIIHAALIIRTRQARRNQAGTR